MTDLINQYKLNFEIQSSKITHRSTGSTINFRGFREQGAFNIQGMEGIDITWIDEAQALTKQTLDVLIPTIRKDNAKIFFTMNRHVVDDPAFALFEGRSDCLHIHINYYDNKHCTEALKKEAQECKKKSQADYDHIWDGQPLRQSEDAVFGHEELVETIKNKYPMRQGYGYKIGGFDVARYGDDKCASVAIQQMGALHWEMVFVDEWDHRDLSYTTGRIMAISHDEKFDRSIIDEDGIGAGPLDMLVHGRQRNDFTGFRNLPLNFKDNKDYANIRTANAYKLKDMILKGRIVITDPATIKELTTLRYTFDHYQRKILVSKDMMRSKYQIKSPNRADALIMTVSLVDEVRVEQDKQYYPVPNQYAKEENLFQLAGVR